MAEEIIIDIAPNGDVTVEGHGIKGPDCEALTKEIEHALGVVVDRKRTAEFYETPRVKRKVDA